MGALEVQFWRAFCTCLGREDLLSRQFDPEAIPQVAETIATRTSRDWLDRFTDDACVALVRTPAQALDDEYVQRRGFAPLPEGPAPALGADTDDVLAETGIAPTVVQKLTRSGVISGMRSAARTARAARLGAMLARRKHAQPQQTA